MRTPALLRRSQSLGFAAVSPAYGDPLADDSDVRKRATSSDLVVSA
jgi:hypothetical protein